MFKRALTWLRIDPDGYARHLACDRYLLCDYVRRYYYCPVCTVANAKFPFSRVWEFDKWHPTDRGSHQHRHSQNHINDYLHASAKHLCTPAMKEAIVNGDLPLCHPANMLAIRKVPSDRNPCAALFRVVGQTGFFVDPRGLNVDAIFRGHGEPLQAFYLDKVEQVTLLPVDVMDIELELEMIPVKQDEVPF